MRQTALTLPKDERECKRKECGFFLSPACQANPDLTNPKNIIRIAMKIFRGPREGLLRMKSEAGPKDLLQSPRVAVKLGSSGLADQGRRPLPSRSKAPRLPRIRWLGRCKRWPASSPECFEDSPHILCDPGLLLNARPWRLSDACPRPSSR